MTDSEIVEAGLAIVISHGYQALTFARAADAVGLSPASLAHRFKSRDQFVRAVSKAVTAAMEQRCREDSDGSTDLAAFLASFVDPETAPDMIMNQFAFLQVELADPDLAQDVRRRSEGLVEVIAAMIGRELEELRPDRDSRFRWARVIERQLVGLQLCWSMQPEGALRDRIAEDTRLLVRAFERSAQKSGD